MTTYLLKTNASMLNLKLILVVVASFFSTQSSASSAITLPDKALQNCVMQTMKKAQITQPNQLLELKCHNKGIESLQGIEQWNNLQNLSMFGNNISSANLTQLTQLKSINLAKNKLKTLNIQGLAELQSLYLFKNKLKTINFAGLTSLQKMRIMQNRLEALDILPLTALTEAYLWDNQLEDLQITGLEKLKFLDVKQNPMPDELYDFYDQQTGITISHDGNADDWK